MKDKKLFFGFVALLLVVGLPLTLVSLMQQTNTENRAARHEPTLPQQSFTNLNNTADVEANNLNNNTWTKQSANGSLGNTCYYISCYY